jgi:uncharacterized phage-associated protein
MSEDKKLDNMFNLAKIILYFANYTGDNLYKTKLQKLLFYTQFLYYKTYSLRLLEDDFICDYYGPVIENLDEYLNIFCQSGFIRLANTNYGTIITPRIVIGKEEYTEEEKEILKRVLKKFDKFTATEISIYSHNEKLWKRGEIKCKIDIERAAELNDL